jgi:ribosome-associated protein
MIWREVRGVLRCTHNDLEKGNDCGMRKGYVRSEAAAVKGSEMGLKRALLAAQTAEDNRGTDVVVLDMRELTAVFDYFVLASGASRRQLHAMSEEIDHALEDQMGDRRLGIEGYEESRWILLDYGDVVIHLFEPEMRAYYALEDLWGHAKRVPLKPR